MPNRDTHTHGRLVDGALLAVAATVVWSFGLEGAFLLDDYPAIVENPALRDPWPPFAAMSPPPEVPGAGRPLVGLSLAVNRALGGLDVRGYHVFNTAVHLLATWLLYGCVRQGLTAAGRGATARAAALATALLWAVHPLQSEPVLYILQRSQLMMGACMLGTLLCFLRSLESPRPGRWYAAAAVVCAAGMAAKEDMVVAPLLVLCFDGLFVAGGYLAALRSRPALYAGLAAGWVVLGALMATGPDYAAMGMGLEVEITPWVYLLNQPAILLGYLAKSVWPHPLVIDYGQAASVRFADVAPAFLAVAATVAATGWAVLRRHPLGFAGAWFFLLLAPTSSIVPVASEVGAERRMYLPLAMVLLLIVLGALRLARSLRAGRSVLTLLLLVTVSLAAWGSVRRAADYRDPVRMWQSVLDARPGWRAEHNLGVLRLDDGDAAAALEHFRRATERADRLAEPANAMAVALMQLGRNDEAEAALDEALRRDPEYGPAMMSRGLLLSAADRNAEALPWLERAAEKSPRDAGVHSNLGACLHRLGRLDEALAAYDRAIELDAALADAWINRGVALAALGRRDEAVASLERALELRPGDPLAERYLGQIAGRSR